ncbi:substrate-binding periplasmic protein [Piscirickettsia litoralis]|uniref:Solute-binding protein family 3/N-terminal domain-containing protein n=1 Tax=Piscirickettsia litoralis TaxID=1891921 RepID=A0ABX3A342_9GAMM|nr:transporter substrate-binding domain-containing protein [Piscirickettsia litoralis]ODN41795.1 hypothetical protein BGC07_00870 [Piscirickettsia litoralis]
MFNKLLIFIILSFIGLISVQAKVLLTTGDYPPYTGKHLAQQGIVTYIISQVFKKTDTSIEVAFMPWKRAESYTESGKALAVFPYIFKTKERLKHYEFSAPIISSQYALFTGKSDLVQQNYLDVESVTLCNALGYSMKPIQKWLKTNHISVIKLNDMRDCLKALKSKKVDLVFLDTIAAKAFMQEIFGNTDALFQMKPSILHTDYFLMFSKKYPNYKNYLKIFNATINNMRDSGHLDKIIKNYWNISR